MSISVRLAGYVMYLHVRQDSLLISSLGYSLILSGIITRQQETNTCLWRQVFNLPSIFFFPFFLCNCEGLITVVKQSETLRYMFIGRESGMLTIFTEKQIE